MTNKELDAEIRRLFYNDNKMKDIARKLSISTYKVERRIKEMRENGIEVKRWYK
mgnify:CR=1 FL=1